jgi:hypothetical protein
LIRLERERFRCLAAPEELGAARRAFAAQHYLRIPGLVEHSLFSWLIDRIDHGEFGVRQHGDIGRELCLDPDVALHTLVLVANDPELLRFVEDLTGCGHVGSFEGRIYRVLPGAGHYDDWHNDIDGRRLVGMSVNLSRVPYLGGRLFLRDAKTKSVLAELDNVGPGDALLFRLTRDLEHRIEDVAGVTPKTAFAGWFRSEPEFRDMVHRARR